MKRVLLILLAIPAVLFANSYFKDSDMDGVSDRRDRCRHTPFFVLVDSRGCAVKTLVVNNRKK